MNTVSPEEAVTVHGQAAWVPGRLCFPAGSTLCGWYSLSSRHMSWFLRPAWQLPCPVLGQCSLFLGQGWSKAGGATCAQSFSRVQLFATVARQALLSMELSRQECWSGLPCPPPEDLLDPGIKPVSPALAGRFFTISHLGNS